MATLRKRLRVSHQKLLGKLVGLSIGLAPIASIAQPWMDSFDPSVCPGDHQDAVAVRVESGYAFRFPAKVFSVCDPLTPPEDPSLSPYGCPGNPIIARAVSTALGTTQFLPQDFVPHRVMRRPISLTIFGHDGPLSTVRSRFERLDYKRNHEGFVCREESGGQMEACYSCRLSNWRDDGYCEAERHGRIKRYQPIFTARSLPGKHPEIEGYPLIAHCWHDWGNDPTRTLARDCTAEYALGSDLFVVYGYDGNIVTLPLLPAVDLAVRAWIEDRRAPELDSQVRKILERR